MIDLSKGAQSPSPLKLVGGEYHGETALVAKAPATHHTQTCHYPNTITLPNGAPYHHCAFMVKGSIRDMYYSAKVSPIRAYHLAQELF